MPYITSVEKIGYERGVEEEVQRSLERDQARERERVIRRLNRKVGSISESTCDRISTLTIEQLDSLGDDLLDFGSIDDLTTWLDNQG